MKHDRKLQKMKGDPRSQLLRYPKTRTPSPAILINEKPYPSDRQDINHSDQSRLGRG